ncbi:hypothetical protein COA01_30085 [Bacillus cereus]|uniref:hypothetical protein n=1 Tax=Bacillus cereus TaxID=1396 RepID=UPI000BFD9F89|nr:hypothetical protein [Bacillus cereus]PGP14605.1 hypothetical protein COA01_30085 [Bacillus cereus]
MKTLQSIRKAIQENINSIYFGGMEDTAKTLMDLWFHNKAESVYSETEDRGDRWTNWEIQVFKITTDDEVAYFRVEKEVGATEKQSDGVTIVREVIPQEVKVIKYIDKD